MPRDKVILFIIHLYSRVLFGLVRFYGIQPLLVI